MSRPHLIAWILPLGLALAAACAEGSSSEPDTGSTSTSAVSGSGGSGGGESGAGGSGGESGPAPQSCPPGELAIGLDASDTLQCVAPDDIVREAVNEHCHLYFGWSDDCDGCTADPAKWGRVNGTTCNNGIGADNTCAPAMLGDEEVQLFGLNTDGSVNGDDKFYAAMRCDELDTTMRDGPCDAGEVLASLKDGAVSCVSLTAMVTQYVRDHCTLYYGWSDNCDGCTADPSKWGRVTHSSCENGVGADNTCTVASLGGPIVELFGLNTDGDVNGDDKFYLGMSCVTPAEQSQDAPGSCPESMVVTGINEDGTLACASPLPSADALIRTSCYLYTGWRDSCDGCTTPPAKWGRVSQDDCNNGAGADNTCTIATLDGTMVRLFGLNLDGDMDGNDKLYHGMLCTPPMP